MKKTLTPEQQHFFENVAKAAFVNPFSTQQLTLEQNIIASTSGKYTDEQRLVLLLDCLNQQFATLNPDGKKFFHHFPKKQQTLLEICWLFFQYRRHQHLFDDYIKQQEQAGDVLLVLPFAQQLSAEFQKLGFNQQQTEKYIALFFQLRRGFYFISHTVYGPSPSMVQLRIQLWHNLFTFQPQWYLDYLCKQMEDFSTLLLGVTGTGKSMVARAIGCSGYIPFDLNKAKFKESFTRAFQSINLSQYPENLLESELFGHKKGAFTGAIENHQGIFAKCSKYGAVFIDEIGEIDIPTQVKLLTVIQERTFTPVGDHQPQRFEGRVIAATNQDIRQLRTTGQFRDDLYYRLCSDVIHLPSLQQRLQEQPAELAALIHSILHKMLPNASPDLSKQIEQRLKQNLPINYAWPGNVRELEQCIRRICLTGQYQAETANHATQDDQENKLKIEGEPTAQQLLQHYCQQLYQQYNSYEAVARITQLDRRTVKKHISMDKDGSSTK